VGDRTLLDRVIELERRLDSLEVRHAELTQGVILVEKRKPGPKKKKFNYIVHITITITNSILFIKRTEQFNFLKLFQRFDFFLECMYRVANNNTRLEVV
jgi:hypothetical protein